jgi:alpha-L-rhamnosidase
MKKLTLLLCLQCLVLGSYAQIQVSHLLCEQLSNPMGVDAAQPRLSWRYTGPGRGISQTAYEIKVAKEEGSLKSGKDLVWASGKVVSDQSVFVPYSGATLASAGRYYWQVRIWDKQGKPSAWSSPATFQMGLMHPADWTAQWIEPGYTEDSILRPSPYLRHGFSLTKKVRSATVFITSHGLYEAHINGQKVGDACLTPGWTSYNKRLQYQAYDVTSMLKQGPNAVGVVLGSGWYRGPMAWGNNINRYGKTLGLLFQLMVTYTDGTTQVVASDGSWKSSTGAIQASGIYAGETIDDRLEKKGWDEPGYDDGGWSGVKPCAYGFENLVSTVNEPVRGHEVLHPVRIFTTPKGEQVIDFGQNMVGWVEVSVSGKAGDQISLHHAEVLDKEGNFYTQNLRVAKQNDVYILKGEGQEHFHPHFTFQGFRFVKVEGYPGVLKPEDFSAVVLYSDMEKTGSFSCSDSLINQLQHNIEWGQRGNFLDVPTDCPQRDERLGWTGDAEVFSRTASYIRNVDNFFAKWLKDVAADQYKDGAVPHVIPDVLNPGDAGSAGWADVSTIIPWNMYLAYGDKKILEAQYPSMKAWVEYMHARSKDNLWNTGDHFGDWLYYVNGDDEDGYPTATNKYYIAQCFYAHSIQLLVDAASVLGLSQDSSTYAGLLKDVKDAFLREYVTPDGKLTSPSQTGYVLALNFDMLPEQWRTQTARALVDNIKVFHNHLTTGFLGTPYLCHVLTRFGYNDVAYTLLLQQTYPSWLYPVKMGATTIWERWDGIRPDGTFEDAGMNSFNHYAYGAIGDWMYRTVAGIDESSPGYKAIRIQPHPGPGLTAVSASYTTYYGPVISEWKTSASGLDMHVVIPAGTRGTVYIPVSGTSDAYVKEGNSPLVSAPGVQVKGKEDGYVVVEVGSGDYHFTVGQ